MDVERPKKLKTKRENFQILNKNYQVYHSSPSKTKLIWNLYASLNI